MDAIFLQTIIENDYAVPQGHSVEELTPQLTASLGSPDSDVRENSLDVLWGWITAGRYSSDRLWGMGRQMAHNLTVGIGERDTDTVFLRAFSVLILATIIFRDEKCEAGIVEKSPFLSSDDVRGWFEQGLIYLEKEKDLRGYVEGKGWSHAIAHTADLLRDLARSRYLGVADLKCILNAVADKIVEPVECAYLYQEDERLAYAVISALLRDLMDISFLKQWLDRMVTRSDQKFWHQIIADPAENNARHNTQSFLRSLYFQLLMETSNFRRMPCYDSSPSVRDELLVEIAEALKKMDHGRFYKGQS
ncbi:MAG: DUF2785 domain-containing protein [Chloroflexi bacterium]|nr:DUF2785 domain-containing protein [Chloroflexota bacterium]